MERSSLPGRRRKKKDYRVPGLPSTSSDSRIFQRPSLNRTGVSVSTSLFCICSVETLRRKQPCCGKYSRAAQFPLLVPPRPSVPSSNAPFRWEDEGIFHSPFQKWRNWRRSTHATLGDAPTFGATPRLCCIIQADAQSGYAALGKTWGI